MPSLAYLCSDAVALSSVRDLHPTIHLSQAYRCAAKVAASARQAIAFQDAVQGACMEVLPLLLYYAQLQRLKTDLYLADPLYPPSSSVLQHGVSCRRNKRDTYHWPMDFLHVFREGVLQSWLACFHPQVSLPNRLILGDVLGELPDMVTFLGLLYPQFIHAHPVQKIETDCIRFAASRSVASHRNLTVEAWKQAFAQAAASNRDGTRPSLDTAHLEPPGMLWLPADPTGHPWIRIDQSGQYFVLDTYTLPEQAIHFVLLFSLSSLCRYSPVEWSDIVHWHNEADAGVVREYLSCAKKAVLGPSTFD